MMPLNVDRLIDYIQTHKRGTIDDEVCSKLQTLQQENLELREALSEAECPHYNCIDGVLYEPNTGFAGWPTGVSEAAGKCPWCEKKSRLLGGDDG